MTAASPAIADDAPWPVEAYNPAPAEGDVVLPMPCGGAMAFRRVALPSTGVLDDVRVQFGDAQPELGFFSDRRYDVIAGAFGDPAVPGTRYFLIGKYEVTRAQWAALSGDACPDPGMRQRVPQTEISWFDVIGFANRYSQWLLAHARDALPAESGTPGFLRLPTEDEWEYAARGGMAVSSENFLAARFPMPEGAADYIWYQGTGSAEGRLHPIGLLKPNPLGLYDILGNAAEMMLRIVPAEPARPAARPGRRLHRARRRLQHPAEPDPVRHAGRDALLRRRRRHGHGKPAARLPPGGRGAGGDLAREADRDRKGLGGDAVLRRGPVDRAPRGLPRSAPSTASPTRRATRRSAPSCATPAGRSARRWSTATTRGTGPSGC